MRRKDKEITSREWMGSVLKDAVYIELAMADKDGSPYCVPLSYGFDDGHIYIHGAQEGKKIDTLKDNPNVAFNVVAEAKLVRSSVPSDNSVQYRSVSGSGTAHIIEDISEKKAALQTLMRHYDGPTDPMPDEVLAGTMVVRIDISEMTGKNSNP